MKKLLFFIALLTAHVAVAQNYACLQAGVKHYFINGNGYLRGMRIDSVKTYADSVVYYPFHTPRGQWRPSVMDLDSNGASWLGKRVVQLNDGTFLFDNIWHDTVTIKTHAALGDSWVFLNDTSSHFYMAEVIAIDTMTILSRLDSIKTIKITAYDAGGLVTIDTVNNFKIILSKNYGFQQIFDLYTFPYHAPDTAATIYLDYFLSCICGYFYMAHVTLPSINNSVFSLIKFVNPTYQQLYDWNVGDVFEYSVCIEEIVGECIYPYKFYTDTITSKTIVPGAILYGYTGWAARQDIPRLLYHAPEANYPYLLTSESGTFTIPNDYLIDTLFMPEEFNNPYHLHYYPFDTNYCSQKDKYKFIRSDLYGIDFKNTFTSDGGGPEIDYKIGLGLTNYHLYYRTGPPTYVVDTTLIYYEKGGVSCGNYFVPSEIASSIDILENNEISFHIFPNPASDNLTIMQMLPPRLNKLYTININNFIGQTVATFYLSQKQKTVEIRSLPAGVYNLCITSESGERENKKLIIIH